jgi:hypothetical protein
VRAPVDPPWLGLPPASPRGGSAAIPCGPERRSRGARQPSIHGTTTTPRLPVLRHQLALRAQRLDELGEPLLRFAHRRRDGGTVPAVARSRAPTRLRPSGDTALRAGGSSVRRRRSLQRHRTILSTGSTPRACPLHPSHRPPSHPRRRHRSAALAASPPRGRAAAHSPPLAHAPCVSAGAPPPSPCPSAAPQRHSGPAVRRYSA